jgi:dienelactone hydrolase
MAGNAKEWCWNETGDKRFILGGGWNELSYAFADMDAQPPFDRRPTYGFRLVKYIDAPPAAASNAIVQRTRDFTKERPVDAAIFEAYRGLYRYDATVPLNAVVEATEDAPSWRKETVTLDAAYGRERVRVYVFIPKVSSPPYQSVLYFPGGDAMILKSSHDLRMVTIDFLIQSGRAVIYPVYKGTFERSRDPGSGPTAFRDLMIQRSKDAGRALDYLAGRRDLDAARIGYYGISAGAEAGVIFTAIEPRFKASVLLGGGLETAQVPPEVDAWNFAPRVHVPTLMVNAKSDFGYPIETSQLPLFHALGTEQKNRVLTEGGHIPVRIHEMMKAILDWYDRFMGPVRS